MKNVATRMRAAVLLYGVFLLSCHIQAQTIFGTNQPGDTLDVPITVTAGTTNLAISVGGTASTYSHLLLKAGGTPSDTNFDFLAAANGRTNAINLELPELVVTNYVVRVRTPTNSLAHQFTLSIVSNVTDMRTVRPATKSLVSTNQGTALAGVWNYFRVDVPTNVAGWRVILNSSNSSPDLYIQRDVPPTASAWLKRSQGQTNDVIAFTPTEVTPGAYFIGIFGVAGTTSYTLRTEMISFTTLTWDPGVAHLGTQVFTNQGTNAGDYYFKVTANNTALNAWRTALNVLAGEASIYLAKGTPPSVASNAFKSERIGSDGFVLGSSSFSAGEDWYYMVSASAGAQWTLVTGEPFVTDLGTVAADGSSGSGNVTMGAEGMRFFKTTVPADTVGWRLWLNGLTNNILLKKTSAPLPTVNELSGPGQLLVVPSYLVGGQLYFVGIPGNPGTTINLDSRQQPFTDIPFSGSTNLNVSGYGYTTFRVQVPVDQIAWQVSVVPGSGNPNVAVRGNQVPNELNNEAYSEVPGMVTDSILLVPETLSDGTFYITVYGTNSYSCVLQSGTPETTEIDFTSVTTNTDTNRVGWRLFKVSDINQQLGALGWDLFLTNFAPGTRIALRRNAAPGIWTFRNPTPGTAGEYDVLSAGDFLQRPGQQADVWYVGVYNPTNALGAFALITRELTADPLTFSDGSAPRVAVPAGKWQFFRVDVPTDTLGWDVRLTGVLAGSPRLVVRREALPISLSGIGFTGTVTPTNWPNGNQWVAGNDWTARNFSPDGITNETGRILTMGYGRPLQAGTYYVGIISPAGSSNEMTYTLLSRGMGPGHSIPVQDVAYIGNVTNTALPAREPAIYRVTVPTNAPSWKVRLQTTAGDAVLAVAKDYIPNITATESGSVTNTLTAGKKMLSLGNEHFVQLPPAFETNVFPGTYYLVVASEGLPGTNATRIGTSNASYVLESLGPMPEIELGLLETNDLVYAGQLEGGESTAFHFENNLSTLGFELSLENTVGNPVMVSRPFRELANPGAGSPLDAYGNEGGGVGGLAVSSDIITVAYPWEDETIMIKARELNNEYPDASYTLRVRKLVPTVVAFDGGTNRVENQINDYEFFQVDVPADALGWDIRLVDVVGNPAMVVARGTLALHIVTPGWNPGSDPFWPFGANWIADDDWTQRSESSDGSENEDGRILAMGMGRPLEPGTYYIGVNKGSGTCSYTVQSRGIGAAYSIPVVDLPFAGGSVTNVLPAREAAYYRVIIPPSSASWQARVRGTNGEFMLVTLTNSIPSVLSGRSSTGGKAMQKAGNEHYVLLPANNQTSLTAGTNYFAVVSEGVVDPALPDQIGTNGSTYVIESRGALLPLDLGLISNTEVLTTNSLEQGEVKAYQFSVPAGTVSLEARLQNVIGTPAMVLRVGSLFPNPGAASTTTGQGSVPLENYGNEGGQTISALNGNANSSLITVANPTNGVYTLLVKARTTSTNANANYVLSVRTVNNATVAFDGGSLAITNHDSGTWKYFQVEVPTNALGWDVRLTSVVGAPKMVVRRDLLPVSLSTTPWNNPGNLTNWPSTNQWAADADWTRREFNASGTVSEDGRILAMGMNQPLKPGTYYVGVLNNTSSNSAYTLLSRGIGPGMSLPLVDLNYSGGSATNNNVAPREAVYYRITVPPTSPGWKLKLTPTVGEAMLLVLKDNVPNVDSGRVASPISGKVMGKAGNEHYLLMPGVTNISSGVYYLAVVSEGLNPSAATRIGTGSSSFVLTSIGDVPINNLGTVSPVDIVTAQTLEGGESRIYLINVPSTTAAVEVRLENRVGNPVLAFSSNSIAPDPGGGSGNQKDPYGVEGGITPTEINSNIVTIANAGPGTYAFAVKARVNGNVYPDASYTLRVRENPITDLNFTAEFNTNGLSNVGTGLLVDAQRAFYKVIVPSNVWNQPVIGWELNLSQLSGIAAVRVRKDSLPSDSVSTGMLFTANSAIIAPPYLTNGTWYVEVRGTNSTSYTLTSSSLALQRPAWVMPGIGESTTTPGLSGGDFADTGVDTNGVALPGDQGIDLELGRHHYYAVTVPTNNGALMRVQLDAISGNSDLYMRVGRVPTVSHTTNGTAGTSVDRTVAGAGTKYGNWVPLNGLTETRLLPGTWYLAVRAPSANARYRLRLSTGNIQDLEQSGGSATNQLVAGNDWRYYRVVVPTNPPPNWHVTFSQQSGDVVMYLRDTIPPGNGETLVAGDYNDWVSDDKNSGPYLTYDLPGMYTFLVPPIRPGSVYYLGFRGKSDSTFSVTSTTSGTTNPLPPIIEFYGGSATNYLPSGGLVTYRIYTPGDGLRWRHTSIHSNSVQVYVENGTIPTRTSSDDFRSTTANSSNDKFLTGYPWVTNQVYYLVATNTSAISQPFSITMNGSNTSADDDADGMPDIWELQYFNGLSPTASSDFDVDGVSNLNEYLEGTNPADKNSFRPRLFVLSTNGVVAVNPSGSNFVMGTSVTLTATPNTGFLFLGWSGALSGTANPVMLTMNTNKTVIPKFRIPADDFVQRIALMGLVVTHTGLSNTGGTKETGEPNHAGNSGGKSLWWTWTSPFSGAVRVTTAGSSFRNALAVYNGLSVSNLTIVATNLAGVGTNTSQVTFNANSGTVYQIAVDGFNGTNGNVVLNIAPTGLFLANARQDDGTFQFTLHSAVGQPVRLEASTNLINWVTLMTTTNSTGTIPFNDPDATNYNVRFYRIVWP